MTPRTSTAVLLAGAGALAVLGSLSLPCARRAALAQDKPAAAKPRDQAEAALRKGLAWLKTQQQENGSYGKIPGPEGAKVGEAGISALALRAMAKAPAALRKELELEPVMEKLAGYLVSLQGDDGAITNPKSGLTTYRTSLSILALSSMDARRFAPQVAKARGFLERTQFSEQNLGGDPMSARKNVNYGGWGYDEKAGMKPNADLSNSHFALEALKEAGVPPESPVWQRAVTFLQRCQNRSESNDLEPAGVKIGDDGGFMYDPARDEGKSTPEVLADGTKRIPSYASMTYAGLMSLLHASLKKDDARVKAAHDWIAKNYTLEENRGLGGKAKAGSKQGLFYYYHTFAKALAAWGEEYVTPPEGTAHSWSADLVAKLTELQKPDGSWANDTKRWWEDDPVLCTSYSLIALDIAWPFVGGGEEPPPAAAEGGKPEGK